MGRVRSPLANRRAADVVRTHGAVELEPRDVVSHTSTPAGQLVRNRSAPQALPYAVVRWHRFA